MQTTLAVQWIDGYNVRWSNRLNISNHIGLKFHQITSLF